MMQISEASLGTNWLWEYASWCLGQNLSNGGALYAVRRDAYSRGYTKGHMAGYQRGYLEGQRMVSG